MKKCPFCAEEIQDEAVKCRYCGEFLSGHAKGKWYFKTHSVIIAFLCIGPLMLPLIWFNPNYGRKKKIIASIAVGIVSILMFISFASAVKSLSSYYRVLFSTY